MEFFPLEQWVRCAFRKIVWVRHSGSLILSVGVNLHILKCFILKCSLFPTEYVDCNAQKLNMFSKQRLAVLLI